MVVHCTNFIKTVLEPKETRVGHVESCLLSELNNAHLAPVLEMLKHLRTSPPQVLLLDGGTEAQRRDLARYWAALNLCENADEHGPCLNCATCSQIAEDVCTDLLGFDGSVSKKDDEENPGFFRAFTAENARDLKFLLQDAPHGKYRVVFLTGISASRAEAPNALLKVLEEPNKWTLFVLLVPQREQILATLVSRALCLTLPCKLKEEEDEEVTNLLNAFTAFLEGRGDFLGIVSQKGFLTHALAQKFLLSLQRALIQALGGLGQTDLERFFQALSRAQHGQLISWLQEAQQYLQSPITPVNPLRVLEALCMNIALLRLR